MLGTLHTRNACSVLLTVTPRWMVVDSDAILLDHECSLLGGAVRTATFVIYVALSPLTQTSDLTAGFWWRSPSDELLTVVGAEGRAGEEAILSALSVVL
jgi:hypothetical protein